MTDRSISEQQPQPELDLTGGVDGRSMRFSNIRDQIAAPIEDGERQRRNIRIVQNIRSTNRQKSSYLAPGIYIFDYTWSSDGRSHSIPLK